MTSAPKSFAVETNTSRSLTHLSTISESSENPIVMRFSSDGFCTAVESERRTHPDKKKNRYASSYTQEKPSRTIHSYTLSRYSVGVIPTTFLKSLLK